jgi:hypothetical protein
MKLFRRSVTVVFLLLGLIQGVFGQAGKWTNMSAAMQEEFLSQRLPSGAITGTFDAFASMMFAMGVVILHTNDAQVNATELHSPFPDFYQPTKRELLDTIALQTSSSWTYDPKTGYFVFAKPAIKKPFTITLADQWTTKDMGIYVGYRPPTFPSGMDVYYYGNYSSDDPKQAAALWQKIRNIWAINFGSNFKRTVTLAEMQTVKVDGVDALYFQTPAPNPKLMFREWALVKNGRAFVIISVLPVSDKQSVADVETMVGSFHVTS